MAHSYTIAGLAVASEIPLPGLHSVLPGENGSDVRVSQGAVPMTLDGTTAGGPTWAIAGDRFLLRIPGIARFLLAAGNEIVCAPEPGVGTDDVAAFVRGPVMGILLHQRGQIVLHASAAAVGERAVLFCGRSGAGKSTVVAALGQQGYPCFADDACAISLRDDGRPVVFSDGRQIGLWANSIAHLNLEHRSVTRVRRVLEKFYVDHDGPRVEHPLELGAIYELREAKPPHKPGIDQPSAVDRMLLIRRHAYRPLLVARMGQRAQYFKAATLINRFAGVYRLTQPAEFAQLPASVARLERHWEEINLVPGSNR